MKFKVLIAATVAVLSGLLFVATAGQASALPNCGGQHALLVAPPYTCVVPDKVIDGTTFGAVVRANGNAPVAGVAGTGVEVVISIKAGTPTRTVPTLVGIVHHDGISGAGGAFDEAHNTMAPGQRTITLRDSAACRDGQLDIKAVNILPGSGDTFRIGGPNISNSGPECVQAATTTAPSTTTATTTPGSTVPSTTAPLSSTVPTTAPTGSGGPGVSATVQAQALPETGYETGWPTFIAVLLISLGLAALGLTYHRRGLRH